MVSWWATGQGPLKQGARGQGVAAELLIRPAAKPRSPRTQQEKQWSRSGTGQSAVNWEAPEWASSVCITCSAVLCPPS